MLENILSGSGTIQLFGYYEELRNQRNICKKE